MPIDSDMKAEEERRKLGERLVRFITVEYENSGEHGMTLSDEDVRALSAELRGPVKVKPLEWVPTIISERHLRDVAKGLDGLIAYEVGVEENYVLVNGRGLGIKQLGKFPCLADAKAAAQSDYEARVRAMLADRGNDETKAP